MAREVVFRCCPWNRRRCRPGQTFDVIKSSRMNFYLLITALFLLYTQGVECLVIDNLDVPLPLINGSKPAIILDCDFKYSKNDTSTLVIQWFYNHSIQPMYQWIPPNSPDALGEFKNRLDLGHKVSEDPFTMHRALRILNPTVELSGNYRCMVASGISEDAKNKSLVVYVPAERLEINVTKPSDGSVNVSCTSEGGYPEPLISLVMYRDDKEQAEPVDNFRLTMRDGDSDGHTDVIGYKTFDDRYLSKTTVFECVLAIADADYKETQRYTYHPDIVSGTCGLESSRLLTVAAAATTAILSIMASTTTLFLTYNTFRS